MEAQIQKFGNSLGIRIPKKIANKLCFRKDLKVEIEISNNHLIITPTYSELDVLVDKITDDNIHKNILEDDIIKGKEGW